jgi:predicted TIM-barrel fold metal-dependent hydrolase
VRIVALEEHFLLPDMLSRLGNRAGSLSWLTPSTSAALADIGDDRLLDMDVNGIDVQVLSASMPGADLLDGAAGVEFATTVNDRLAEAVAAHHDRFAGFAHLPMRSPAAAADELERAVEQLRFCGAMINGMSAGLFLDDPSFEVLLERAQALNVPLYLHPNLPPREVSAAYYSGLPEPAGQLLATGLFGWHAEVAVHVLRLVLSGATARYPSLKFIVGHMGEMLPAAVGRADAIMQRTGAFAGSLLAEIVDRVYITTSGVFTVPPLLAALTTFGADRIMFSVDYPYSRNADGAEYFRGLPVSPIDRAKIAHRNADDLLGLKASR